MEIEPHLIVMRPHLRNFMRFLAPCLLVTALGPTQSDDARAETRLSNDHIHDFDWEFGSWKTDMVRLKHPLSGQREWLHYNGTTTVRKVWGGKANLLELDVHGPVGQLQALSLRLYDPDTRKWSIHYANSASGDVSAPPAVGTFEGSKGVFQDKETYQGREVMVMFLITVLSPNCAHFEQSFSEDGGYTWEANWIVTDTRIGADERRCKRLARAAHLI